MTLKSKTLLAALVLSLASGAGHAVTVNAFANGGFETDNTAANPPGGVTFFAEGWLSAPTGNPVTRSIDAHTGSFSALLSVPNGFGGSTLFQNSVDHGAMAPLDASAEGQTPTLSFWAKGDVSTTGNVLFALRYLNGTGTILDGNGGNHFFQGNLSNTVWTQISFAANAIPVGTKAVFLEMNTAVGPLLDGRLNAVKIDDVYLGITAAVPEPETYALMLAGLGLVGAVARRRSKNVS